MVNQIGSSFKQLNLLRLYKTCKLYIHIVYKVVYVWIKQWLLIHIHHLNRLWAIRFTTNTEYIYIKKKHSYSCNFSLSPAIVLLFLSLILHSILNQLSYKKHFYCDNEHKYLAIATALHYSGKENCCLPDLSRLFLEVGWNVVPKWKGLKWMYIKSKTTTLTLHKGICWVP